MRRQPTLFRKEQQSALLDSHCFPDFALLAYFFQHGSIITTHSFPCTPGPSRYCFRHVLKEKVSVCTVPLHLAPGVSLWFGKNNLSNSAIKYTGERKKIMLQGWAPVLTFSSKNELKVHFHSYSSSEGSITVRLNYQQCCSPRIIHRGLTLPPSFKILKHS